LFNVKEEHSSQGAAVPRRAKRYSSADRTVIETLLGLSRMDIMEKKGIMVNKEFEEENT